MSGDWERCWMGIIMDTFGIAWSWGILISGEYIVWSTTGYPF